MRPAAALLQRQSTRADRIRRGGVGVGLMHVAHYSAADGEAWNDFVRASRNGTFLLERAYMDYHSNRFHDASLIVRGHEEEIVAVLPANRTDNVVTSHGGLTYGGLI